MNEKARNGRLLLVAWLGALIFAIYGPALSFPFFSDDFFQLPFLDAHSLRQLWQTAEGLFFYRPLAFSLWKIWHGLLAGYQPAAFHALNLLFHWLNCVLVAWITAILGPKQNQWVRALLAASLFALYPFSYEAIAWVAAVMHPFFLTLTLLSVAAYLQMRRSNRPIRWLTIGLLTAALSPFAHENGILTLPLIWLIALTLPNGGKLKRREMFSAALWLLPALLWFLIWQQVPARDGSGGLSLNQPNTMVKNALYLVQGLGYPLAWLGGWLRDNTSLNSTGAALVATLPAILILITIEWRRGFTRQRLLPWLWTAVSVAPPILFLPNLHVIAAPRMFMLPAVGIAWLWADAFYYFYAGRDPLPSVFSRFRRHYRLGIAAVFLFALLLQNVAFINSQLNLYRIGGTAITQASLAAVEANGQGRSAVFINLPAWIAPQQATYAIGQEGDNLILGPDMIQPLVWAQTGQKIAASAVRYDDIRVQTPYYTGPVGEGLDLPALLEEGAAVYVSRYETAEIRLEPAGQFGVLPPSDPPLASFGESINLLAATAETLDNQIKLTLTWQVLQPVPFEMTVFVHGLDENNMIVNQADGAPIAGTLPFGLFPPGTTFQDIRLLPAAQIQTLQIGLYSQLDGTRWPALSSQGQPYVDDAALINVP